MILYHYTSTAHLPKIIEDGFLKPTESNVSAIVPNAGPDVVWLTDFANARNEKGLDGSVYDKREVRITVDVRAIRWQDWAPAATMDPMWRDSLIRTGGGDKIARHWWVFPGRIHFSRWVEVHVKGQLYISRGEREEVSA